ncbi:MAG: hypothetical protein EXR91_01020 [Gemmatimonadetes bacterium]|nr:hypothetical protein [Gemmatimonadota bacterium]
MTEDSVRDRFLQAEEEASELIEALNQLRTEMGGYRDVRESLEGAVDATQAAANGLVPISVRMKELLLSLRELGFVELHDDIRAIGKLVESVKRLEQSISGLQEGQTRLQGIVNQELVKQTRRHYLLVGLLVLLGVLVLGMSFLR